MTEGNEIACLILYNGPLKDSSPESLTEENEYELLDAERVEIAKIRSVLRELGYSVRTLGIPGITPRVIKQISEINPDFIFRLTNLSKGLFVGGDIPKNPDRPDDFPFRIFQNRNGDVDIQQRLVAP